MKKWDDLKEEEKKLKLKKFRKNKKEILLFL